MKKLVLLLLVITMGAGASRAGSAQGKGDGSAPRGSMPSAIEALQLRSIGRIDSICVSVDSISSRMENVSRNTNEKKFIGVGFSKWDLSIAFFALLVAIIGLIPSYITAFNVKRVSYDVQMAQFDDLIRHLYRNLIVSLAFSGKVLGKDEHTAYPSEEHLLKLKVLPEDVLHLEKYNSDTAVYKKMHGLKLLLRNYDIEIETAMMHLKDKNIGNNVLENDLDTLVFKPLFLVAKIMEIALGMKSSSQREEIARNAASIMACAHISNVMENDLPGTGAYADLVPMNSDTAAEKPLDGLRRAGKQFHDFGSPAFSAREPFSRTGKEEAFRKYMEKLAPLCAGTEEGRPDFARLKRAFEGGEFDFKENLPAMIAIDAAIEAEKIHMIEIV